jgi:hypothetical protein
MEEDFILIDGVYLPSLIAFVFTVTDRNGLLRLIEFFPVNGCVFIPMIGHVFTM